ncbi:hypothetical protein COCON_G00182720 [Conger conger]|uniref:SWIM-type domain-containing protein n=1 Tax=Conger conger TaxID=82655 RepID=A0A9Q1D5L4_CONCO|nr:hypothetical protein COCON_G00182720 [Conger conger]
MRIRGICGSAKLFISYRRAFKSTDACQYSVAGWVNDTNIWHLETKNIFVITGHVNHSQALNTKATCPWIVVQEIGTVVMAHCTCMAGLGEVCSHAAALMFTVLAAVDKREGQTCTEKPCAWTKPSMKKLNMISCLTYLLSKSKKLKTICST